MKKKNKNRIEKIGLVLAVLGLLLLSMINITIADIYEDIDKASSDYEYKLDLAQEQSQRLDMWYAANSGRSITGEQLSYLKSVTDEFIKRQNNAMESGRQYKNYLEESLNNPRIITPNVVANIKRIDQNEDIMRSDEKAVVANYMSVVNTTDSTLTREQKDRLIKKIDDAINAITPDPNDFDKYWEKYKEKQKKSPGFDIIASIGIISIMYMLIKR